MTEDRVKTKLVHTRDLIVDGKVILTDGGHIVSSGGGDINIDAEGSGSVMSQGTPIGPIEWIDEGTPKGLAQRVNVVGAGAAVAVVGGEATLNVGGASGILEIQKDSVRIEDASILDYVGTGVKVGVLTGIATLDFPNIPTANVLVDPAFAASDDFNQYPTIAQGIIRAGALLTAGAVWVEVQCRPALYDEHSLAVLSSMTLTLDDGACLAHNGANTMLEVHGTGRLRTVFFDTPGNHPSVPGILFKSGWIGRVDGLVCINLGGVRKGLIEFENQVSSALPTLLEGMLLVEGSPAGNTPCIIGAGRWQNYTLGGLIINFVPGGPTVSWSDGTYVGSPAVMYNFLQTVVEHGDVSQDPIVFTSGTRSRMNMEGTILDLGRTGDVDRFDFTEGKHIAQTTLPNSGKTVGSVESAISNLDSRATVNSGNIEGTKENVAILAAELIKEQGVKAGDFNGMLVESFVNFVDLPTVFGVHQEELLIGQVATFSAEDLVDDFESYADDAALQVVWVSSDFANLPPTLFVGGAPQGSQYMLISFSGVNSSNDQVDRTFGTARNWQIFDRFEVFIRGQGDSELAPLRLILEDGNGNQAVWPYAFYPTGAWICYTFNFEDAVVDTDFEWWAVTNFIWESGTIGAAVAGAWDIDVIEAEPTAQFAQRALLDPMNALTDWSIAGSGVSMALGTTNPREGTGYIEIDGGANNGPGPFELTRTWPGSGTYADILVDDAVLRCQIRVANATVAGEINGMDLVLEDENTNTLTISSSRVLPRKILSTDLDWVPYEFFLEDGVEAGAIDMTKIVEVTLKKSSGGDTGTWKLDIDFLEVGEIARVVSAAIDIGEEYNEIKLFGAYDSYVPGQLIANRVPKDDLRVSVSSQLAAQFTRANFRAGNAISVTPYGATQFGEWLPINGGAVESITFRIMARLDVSFGGLTILWRKV